MKRRLSLVLVSLMLISTLLTACSSQPKSDVPASSETPAPSGKDTFVIGLEAGYAPFNWTQMDDSNGGVAM